VISLAGPDLYAIYRRLKGSDLVLDVNIYGNDVHAVVERAEAAVPAIRDHLASAGLALTAADPIPPSIEDVFVRLTRSS
jgi:hypothetical protein